MRWYVDTWDPAYGASFEAGGPSAQSSAPVDAGIELPAAAWRPLTAPVEARAPDVVLLVDGVRRIDAVLWTEEPDGTSFPGLAASYAAGAVRCDLRRGLAELAAHQVRRSVFTASPTAGEVVAGQIRYGVHQVGHGELAKLPAAVQGPMTALEVEVSAAARSADDLLVVDGRLRNRRHLPRTIGYVKSQSSEYLPAALTTVVLALRAGQRSPVFAIGGPSGVFSWYLRLPGSAGAPWAGMVRVECSPDLTAQDAVALADLSLVTLPRFASTAYKDPRAPQNLVPIAGLERRLRGLLGDQRLLHRALATAAARVPAGQR